MQLGITHALIGITGPDKNYNPPVLCDIEIKTAESMPVNIFLQMRLGSLKLPKVVVVVLTSSLTLAPKRELDFKMWSA